MCCLELPSHGLLTVTRFPLCRDLGFSQAALEGTRLDPGAGVWSWGRPEQGLAAESYGNKIRQSPPPSPFSAESCSCAVYPGIGRGFPRAVALSLLAVQG